MAAFTLCRHRHGHRAPGWLNHAGQPRTVPAAVRACRADRPPVQGPAARRRQRTLRSAVRSALADGVTSCNGMELRCLIQRAGALVRQTAAVSADPASHQVAGSISCTTSPAPPAERELHHIAYHDSPPDLANRSCFNERLAMAVERAAAWTCRTGLRVLSPSTRSSGISVMQWGPSPATSCSGWPVALSRQVPGRPSSPALATI